MDLNDNQAALILEASDEGEITVNVAAAEMDGMAGSVCQAIAKMLMYDADFQEKLMEMLDEE